MLAPMQSVTNRALRSLFAKWARPDVLFTEFMRVKPSRIGGPLNPKDLREARGEEHGIPLVFQLIGGDPAAVVDAARAAQRAGAAHLNLNVGCPFGRMGAGSGGNLLRRTPVLEAMLAALRAEVTGSLSVKVRAGYDDPEQLFSLLPLFEAAGVDFLVLHPRTVAQAYDGEADHRITARVV
ncbi:MAG TPA: dihydrouridine synthase, partial [Myxococcales bacterium]|nr:dihydrouridine synthase [Myxococcales bacterium]